MYGYDIPNYVCEYEREWQLYDRFLRVRRSLDYPGMLILERKTRYVERFRGSRIPIDRYSIRTSTGISIRSGLMKSSTSFRRSRLTISKTAVAQRLLPVN